ncbi:hypothetical protein [Celerinatantimonas diazotrophica]|nr:hypothetical protein [Celerinatantimonas diazotrophica]
MMGERLAQLLPAPYYCAERFDSSSQENQPEWLTRVAEELGIHPSK